MAAVRRYSIIIATMLCAVLVFMALLSNRPLYRGPQSGHFDGTRFFGPEANHGFADMMRWLWEMETVEWPEWIDDPPQPPPPASVGGPHLRITHINHATMLIQTGNLNILTDPIWSRRAGPVSWLGAERLRAPGVDFDDLPEIHVVLISHDHYDHLDLPTLDKLNEKYRPQIVTGLAVKSILAPAGMTDVIELDWWQTYALPESDVSITFVPSRHNSGRYLWGGDRTLWGGFVIDGPGGRVYFAGDTGDGQFIHALAERFDGFRLTIFPLGNYEKRWFMKSQHMNPDDAVRAHRLLRSRQSVGMHFGTFREHPEQAIDAHETDLAQALEKYRVHPDDFWVLGFGEGRDVGN